MGITKEVSVDRIEVLETGHIQVRVATRIMEDGVELGKTFHRHVLAPGDPLEGEDERVKAIAMATWTDGVVASYKAHIYAAG